MTFRSTSVLRLVQYRNWTAVDIELVVAPAASLRLDVASSSSPVIELPHMVQIQPFALASTI